MITRAHIRRQLRKNGGIMNVTPRQGYFLGKIVKGAKKAVDKVLDVGSQVIKSPVGKAALIGLGGAGLMGAGPLGTMLGGVGSKMGLTGLGGRISPFLFGAKGISGVPGQIGKYATPGLLGKLGLTKGGGSLMPTALGGVTAAGLMTYFMGKGKTEEEATQLAQDVKRGKGLGLDLIKADIKKYRTGALSGSQMFDKGYHFLTPRNYIGAKGGRVGYGLGSIVKKAMPTDTTPTGGVSMDKTRAENIAANKAQAAGLENIFAQGRSRLPGYTPQVATTSGGGGGGSEVIVPTSGPALDLRLEEKKQADIFKEMAPSSTSTNIPTGKYAGTWNPDRTLVSTAESPVSPGTPGEWMYPNEAAAMGIYPRMDYEGNILETAGEPGSTITDGGYKYYINQDGSRTMVGLAEYNQGGRVGLANGTLSSEDVGKYSFMELMPEFKEEVEEYKRTEFEKKNPPEKIKKLMEKIKKMKKSKKEMMASGGRIGLYAGGNGTPLPEDPTKPINPWTPKPKKGIKSLEAGASSIKVEGDVRPENMKMAEIPKGLSMQDAVKTFTLSNGRKPKDVQEVIDFFKNRKLSAQGGRIGYASGSKTLANYSDDIVNEYKENVKEGYKGSIKKYILEFYGPEYLMAQGGRIGKFGGGMPRIPMGMPRVNAGGIRELDYRQSGGFVPMGVKEKADDVPAMLSKNEFVMTADAVRGAGGGSVEKGAQRMYDTMKRLEGKIA